MYDKTFIGRRCASVSKPPELEPISKIVLWVDSENCYEAGDSTGREFETTCPYGSQQMADDLLAKLRGYVYKPLEAEDAIIDPAAEIGDAVTVDGRYTILANAELSFDSLLTFNVSAPGASELPQEYSFSNNEKVLSRKIARTRSLISKTAEEIRLEINGLDGKYTALAVTIDGVTVTDSTGTTKIKGSSIETSTLKVNAANITGTLTVGNLPAGVAMTSDIPSDADITVITNNAIRTASISANQVTAGTFNGVNLDLSGLMRLVDNFGNVYGYVGTGAGNASGVVTTGVVLRNIYDNSGFIATDGGARMYYGDNAIYCVPTGCFSTSEMKVSSDARLKNSISYDLSKEEKMFATLKPCSFSYNRDESGKKHWGFIAQELLESVEAAGLTADSLDVVGKDGGDMYALAYGEITSLNTHMIQRLMERVSALEAKG